MTNEELLEKLIQTAEEKGWYKYQSKDLQEKLDLHHIDDVIKEIKKTTAKRKYVRSGKYAKKGK